jgi:deazaflavin-dependent oxidoreductase (nitroreductase family)
MSFYDRLVERFGSTRVGAFFFIRIATHLDRVVMRWSGGRLSSGVGTRFNTNGVLLIATGARTGRLRSIPLLATPVGDRLVLIASKGGHPEHPAWYHNLKKNPRCRIIRAGGEAEYIAREAIGQERQAMWQAAVNHYSGYADYQARVERSIPVMVLEPHTSFSR